jgi:hypothetical protein
MIRLLSSLVTATVLVLVAFNGFGRSLAPHQPDLKVIATVYAHSHVLQPAEPYLERVAGR